MTGYSAASSNSCSVCLDLRHEAVGVGPVHQAVVEGQREVAHGPDGDGVVAHHRPLLDGPDPEDGHLRLVDDRRAEEAAEDAGVRDGEGPALHLLDLELLRARAVGEVVHGAGEAEHVLLVGVVDDGHDEAPVEGHRHRRG